MATLERVRVDGSFKSMGRRGRNGDYSEGAAGETIEKNWIRSNTREDEGRGTGQNGWGGGRGGTAPIDRAQEEVKSSRCNWPVLG